jgi:hypothetical protein
MRAAMPIVAVSRLACTMKAKPSGRSSQANSAVTM